MIKRALHGSRQLGSSQALGLSRGADSAGPTSVLQNYYTLDEHHRIIAVSDNWNTFVGVNGGQPGLLAESILGRSLWSFQFGEPTRMWLLTLFGLARLGDEPVVRPYRCDSRFKRRFMEMRISRTDGKGLHLSHYLLREEEQVDRFHPAIVPSGIVPWRLRCSNCGRVKVRAEWRDAAHERFWENLEPASVVYTVCGECTGDRQLDY